MHRRTGATVVAAFAVHASAASLPPGEIAIDAPGLYAAAFADLDGDGETDAVWTDGQNGLLTVHLGFDPGDRNAGTVLTHPVGSAPAGLEIADADGDGVPDVLVGDLDSNRVTVFLNDGSGGLTPSDSLFVRRGPRHIRAGDLNKDGLPDLVVANDSTTAEIFVFLGVGAGQFELASAFTSPAMHGAMELRDVDGDGLLDIITILVFGATDQLRWLRIHHGLGGGEFEPAVRVEIPPRPNSLIVADLNGNGLYDFVTSSLDSPGLLGVTLGRGGRVYEPAPPIPVRARSGGLHAVDIDGDGLPELLVKYNTSGFDANTIDLLHNLGDARFEIRSTVHPTRLGGVVAVPRLGPSGDLYAAVINGGPARLILVPIDEFARLEGRRAQAVTFIPEMVFSGDVNGDGLADAMYIDADARRFGVLFAGPDGFGPVSEQTLLGPVTDAVAGDLNADGRTDLVVTSEGFYALGILRAQPDGTFTEYRSGTRARTVRLAHLNDDDRPDYITTRTGEAAVYTHLTTPSGVHGPDRRTTLPGQPRAAEPGDADGDGLTDVVALSYLPAGNTVRMVTLLGDGTGGLAIGSAVDVIGSSVGLRLADLNNNGRDDAVLIDANNRLHIHLAGPGGAYSHAGTIVLPFPLGDLLVADQTGDGFADLVLTYPDRNLLAIYAGRGDGTFADPRGWDTGVDPAGLAPHHGGAADRPGLLVGSKGPSTSSGDHSVGMFTPRPCPADPAPPYGTLDHHDVGAFVDAFIAADPSADLAAPFGRWDFWDVRLFVRLYTDGCR